jgi:hypothetical protein
MLLLFSGQLVATAGLLGLALIKTHESKKDQFLYAEVIQDQELSNSSELDLGSRPQK